MPRDSNPEIGKLVVPKDTTAKGLSDAQLKALDRARRAGDPGFDDALERAVRNTQNP